MNATTNNIATFEIASTYVHLCLGASDKKGYAKVIAREGRFVTFVNRHGQTERAYVRTKNGVERAYALGGKRLIFKASNKETTMETQLRLSVESLQMEVYKLNARLRSALPATKSILLGLKQEKEASIKALLAGA